MGEEWPPYPAPPPPALPTPPTASGFGALCLALPREYDGMAAGCQGFVLQLELYLATVRPTPSGGERERPCLLSDGLIPGVGQRSVEWPRLGEGPLPRGHHYPLLPALDSTPTTPGFVTYSDPLLSTLLKHLWQPLQP